MKGLKGPGQLPLAPPLLGWELSSAWPQPLPDDRGPLPGYTSHPHRGSSQGGPVDAMLLSGSGDVHPREGVQDRSLVSQNGGKWMDSQPPDVLEDVALDHFEVSHKTGSSLQSMASHHPWNILQGDRPLKVPTL